MQADLPKKRRVKIRYLVIGFFTLMLLGSIVLFINRGTFFEDPIFGNHLHSSQHSYPMSFSGQRFETLENALKELGIVEEKIIHSFSAENYLIVLTQNSIRSISGEPCRITCYEFYVIDGRYELCGTITDVFPYSNNYGREATLRQDLQRFLGKSPYLGFLNLAELYGALPAWGIADGDWIRGVKIDGQAPDEFIPIEYDGKEYVIWIFYDLKTRDSAANVAITGII